MTDLYVIIDELRACTSSLNAAVDALAGTGALSRDLRPDTGRPDSSIVAANAAQTMSSEIDGIRDEVAAIAERVTACADAYEDVDARAGARLGGS